MKKFLNLFSAVLVCLVLNQTTTLASSHREAPLISNDPLQIIQICMLSEAQWILIKLY